MKSKTIINLVDLIHLYIHQKRAGIVTIGIENTALNMVEVIRGHAMRDFVLRLEKRHDFQRLCDFFSILRKKKGKASILK